MILAAGLSPAWQQILRFERLTVGGLNRAAEARWCASGKVLNVGIALHHLGADAVTLSPVGGETGRCIQNEFRSAGIAARWIETESPTRVCTTLRDDTTGDTTELIENATPLTVPERAEFAMAFREDAARADILVIAGSRPAGTPAPIWRDLLQNDARSGTSRAVLDFRGEELLLALDARPFLIKPNRDELAATTGRDLSDDGDLLDAMREMNRNGAAWVVVSDGPRAVWMTSGEETFRLQPPQIHAVNPIGSGDCLTAGIAWGLQQGLPVVDSVRLGIAAAVENAKRLLPCRLNPEIVRATVTEVRCDPD